MSKHEHIILFLLQAGLFSLLWKIRPEMENSKSSTDNFKGLKKYLTCRQEGEKKKKVLASQGLVLPQPQSINTIKILGVLSPEHPLRPFLGKHCEQQEERLHETRGCAGGEREFTGTQQGRCV